MTVSRRPDYLDHMRSAASEAIGFLEGGTFGAFEADRRTQKAVFMSLIIIGEAAARILERFPDFAAEHPEIAWVDMRGMRNRLTHVYFEVDLAIIWNTVQQELPRLLRSLDALSEKRAAVFQPPLSD